MNVSIIIPVYNEAAQLSACLEAISRQTVQPFEVIVVDNNSDDGTMQVAELYPFVRVIFELRQGVIHARTRGFDAAKGDIIARIDGDTVLPSDWVASVIEIMKDKAIAAVSGAPDYYDFALPKAANAIDHAVRRRLARKLGDTNFLYGANMAMRRSAWLDVRGHLCVQGHMHEDFDLGIHLQQRGHKVIYDETLVASVSSRRIDSGLLDYMRYTLVSPRTYALHRLRSGRHMYPVVLVCWLCYVPGHFLNRAYNPDTERFSMAQLMAGSQARIDPTANVVI